MGFRPLLPGHTLQFSDEKMFLKVFNGSTIAERPDHLTYGSLFANTLRIPRFGRARRRGLHAAATHPMLIPNVASLSFPPSQ